MCIIQFQIRWKIFKKIDPTEIPAWRERNSCFSKIPNISEMLQDIVSYNRVWRDKEKEYINHRQGLSQLKREMALEYFFKLQEFENIGVKNFLMNLK